MTPHPRIAPTADERWLMYIACAIAGLLLGLALCELCALITGAPHITVIFGGEG